MGEPILHQVFFFNKVSTKFTLELDDSLRFKSPVFEVNIFRNDFLLAVNKKFVFSKAETAEALNPGDRVKSPKIIYSLLVLRGQHADLLPDIKSQKVRVFCQ